MKPRFRLSVALAAIGVALATSAGAETGVTQDTIRLGMFGPLTGPVSIYGYPINNGAIAIYKEINEQGGIHGRKIEIVHEDGGCDPAKTRAAVKKLIHSEEVFAVHGGSCSAAVVAARDEFIENKVPLMVMAATLDKISAPPNRYVFTTTLPGSGDGQVMMTFVKSIPGVKKIAIVKHANEWANAKAGAIYETHKSMGLEMVADVTLESKANDATSQVLQIKQANPDATFFVLYPGESAVFLRDSQKYGLSGPFIGTTAVMDLTDLAKRAGSEAALKDTYVGAFLIGPIDSPEMKKYADIYRKHFPDVKVQSLSFYGMSGALTVVDALRRAGPDLTREKYVDALQATKDGDAGPGYCKVNFGPDRRQGCLDGTIWALRDGKIVNLGPTYK
ncbi:MAG: ABC transporter substrate-binding protein [Burkholderiales bacterium]|nr:MAG: ABC transporter substrate-binding protein [Burkholderiales bacterium]